MPKSYFAAEAVEAMAQRVIPLFHPHLATAQITYVFVDKGTLKNGRPTYGKVRKLSGILEFLLEKNFLIEIAQDQWHELNDEGRQAALDHLLERCFGEEDDADGGSMKWSTREPDVQEFSTILRRHGAWNDDLAGFVQVAQSVGVDAMADEVVNEETDEVNRIGNI